MWPNLFLLTGILGVGSSLMWAPGALTLLSEYTRVTKFWPFIHLGHFSGLFIPLEILGSEIIYWRSVFFFTLVLMVILKKKKVLHTVYYKSGQFLQSSFLQLHFQFSKLQNYISLETSWTSKSRLVPFLYIWHSWLTSLAFIAPIIIVTVQRKLLKIQS